MSFKIIEEFRFSFEVKKTKKLSEYKVELQGFENPRKFTKKLMYFSSHKVNNCLTKLFGKKTIPQ